MKGILIRPRFDDPTKYTFDFAAEILAWCRQAGISVVELAETEAIRSRVEEELAKEGVDLFIHYDHGNEDALIGQDKNAVIDADNCQLLKGKEVYTLACLSAKNLGARVWRIGGKYWGYVDVVSFTTDALPEFRRAFNSGFLFRFVEGDTPQNALSRAKSVFDQLSLELVDDGKTMAALAMRYDGDILVYYNGHKPTTKKKLGPFCLLWRRLRR